MKYQFHCTNQLQACIVISHMRAIADAMGMDVKIYVSSHDCEDVQGYPVFLSSGFFAIQHEPVRKHWRMMIDGKPERVYFPGALDMEIELC